MNLINFDDLVFTTVPESQEQFSQAIALLNNKKRMGTMNLINLDDLDFKGAFGVSLTYFTSQAILDYRRDLDELNDNQVYELIRDIGADAIVTVDKMLEGDGGIEELEIGPLVELFEKHVEGSEDDDFEYVAGSTVTAASGFFTEILTALFRQDHYADGDDALAVFAAEPVKDESDGELG